MSTGEGSFSKEDTKVSKRFDHPTSDLTLQSSDRILFKIHRLNLEMHSQAFADAGGTTMATTDEVVFLSETSDVLELMLQYVYLQRQPDLLGVDFEVLKGLAEAVEKYQIYSAMGVCCVRMRECIPEHPVEVLLYAVRHKYPELINESAEATLDFPPYTMLHRLPTEVFAAWIEYQQNYHSLLSKEFTRFGPTRHHNGRTEGCSFWHEHYSLVTAALGTALSYPTHDEGRRRTSGSAFSMRRMSPSGGYTGSGALAGLGGSSLVSPLTTSSSGHKHSPVVMSPFSRLISNLERRQALGGEKCGDCKRELGYWIHQSERDWKEVRRFEEYL